ncbi:hypothetical protein EXIGLDRAFT_665659 [Exidia glandulosa HHB12029]|uniref:S-adenosyl-L-methionine-dependent methyltransferase n=1 Tax=Exidia glandulosa HHB12029 TaxID=1314781 RepID=A0A165PBV7_EXIGL|nr:hypothetical protein EXIGLDRAFT_665659 [Exidia glandulosa HHB12029]
MLNASLAAALGVLAALALWQLYRKSRDPYGLFHLELNTPPAQWLNMGLWRDENEDSDFTRACEALALKVARAAHCVPGGRVLAPDVGHACGDSLLLHLTGADLPQPASLTGITSLSVQHDRARSRVKATGTSIPVELFVGDAIYRRGERHPFAPGHERSYTSILAIDCAYHFDTRNIFLQQAFVGLAPGGYVSLADLAVDPLPPFLVRVLLSVLVGVRLANMCTPHDYAATLRQIGYVDVQVEDISAQVFPGFISFLQSKGGAWKVFALMPTLWTRWGGRFVLVSARKPS